MCVLKSLLMVDDSLLFIGLGFGLFTIHFTYEQIYGIFLMLHE